VNTDAVEDELRQCYDFRVENRSVLTLALFFLFLPPLQGQTKVPPWDLWTDQVIGAIRDRSTLELTVSVQTDYADVFFTSNPAASWFDEKPPYAEHQNEKIRIHGILVYPPLGAPRPALLIGHGHGGHASLLAAQAVAGLGYVAFYIDGPQAGLSTGGPKDADQAWISVDKGPQYGFLYHYAYAGMRALTALEELAAQPGNPYRIDTTRFGVLGASMGGILTTHVNAVDDRIKAAIIMAAAGNMQHTLRYPNCWLYYGIYAGTRDIPYNGSDPLNSIEDIDWDSTAITFMNYFDPIRYATRQHAPVMTLMGTYDQYFPFPNANLMLQAITSAETRENFEKRLWPIPAGAHLVLPHIEWNGIYTTWLLVTNPSGQSRRLNPEAQSPDGLPVQASPVTQYLGPLMSIYLTVEAAAGIGPGQAASAGWLNLDSPDGPLIVTALAMEPKRGSLAATAVDAPAGVAWSMPFYVESAGYWTGLAIANPNESAAQVTITAFGKTGNRLATADLTLEARFSRTQLIYQWLTALPAGSTGHIAIVSSAPVQMVAYFGTDDGASIAAIPLQIISP
jgi:cephalosporin-C deacetylase-like acetyl esterase